MTQLDLDWTQPRYPTEPGYKARSTSLSAARSLNDKAPRLRQLCVDQLLLYGSGEPWHRQAEHPPEV
jgi:hypothetical protein